MRDYLSGKADTYVMLLRLQRQALVVILSFLS